MKLRKALGIISPRWREPSACEACGEPFVCGASITGCWCMNFKLSAQVRADLRSRYRRCLCRKCMEGFARSEGETAET